MNHRAERTMHADRRRRWKIPATVIVGVLVLISLGAAYQSIGSARDRAELPPPGRLVDVGGHDLHLHCTGSGTPTVVLEGGNTAYSAAWAWVQQSLSGTTRVCSYDRAGLAWSDDSGQPRDGRTIARELRKLLDNADEQPAFLLVGHSLGGLYVRSFAAEFPDDVAGVVLVDPSHPDQFERMPEAMRSQSRWGMLMMRVAPSLARFGVLRITNAFGRIGQDLPAWEYRTARLFLSSPAHLRTARAELDAFEETAEQIRTTRLPTDLPVTVLSATEIAGDEAGTQYLRTLHAELGTLTTRTRHLHVEGADHYSIVTHTQYASQVARHVEELVLTVRSIQTKKSSSPAALETEP